MVEAWLLIDERAIRQAAGNPSGRVALGLPRIRDLESVLDPKEGLFDSLIKATEYSGRRQKRFRQKELFRARQRVAEFITSYERLRQLSAFAAFEREVREHLEERGW